MWRELIQSLDEHASFSPGVSPTQIASLEAVLGTPLPADLRGLLGETDGARYSEYDLHLIWPLAMILEENQSHRTDPVFADYMPLNHYLFFSDAGDGELFGFGITKAGEVRDDIYRWNRIDDGRSWAAPNLRTFIEWWLTNKIELQ